MKMAEPMTELAKEFLEMNNFIVRKETKFFKEGMYYNETHGTAGDIDIIAVRKDNLKFENEVIKNQIVAEVKSFDLSNMTQLKEVYEDKFKFIENSSNWNQLTHFFSSKKFDRIIFCFSVSNGMREKAKKYKIKIITAGQIIKHFFKIRSKDPGKWTHYPEWYNFFLIRAVHNYVNNPNYYDDKLLLKDILDIEPMGDSYGRNRFNEYNGEIMGDFIYYDEIVIEKMMKCSPEWFLDTALRVCKEKNKAYLVKKIKKTLENVS
jgi:hypothetical protein